MFHPFGDNLDSLTTLTFLAGCTRRVKLGTSILVLPLHNPILLAKQAAALHTLSGGRLLLGLGAGWCEEEFQLMGVDFSQRGSLMDEYIDVLRELLEADLPKHHGEEISFGDTLFPRPETPLPLLIGGNSARALRRAAERGDGWHGLWLRPEELPPHLTAIRNIRLQRDFQITLRIDVCVHDGAAAESKSTGLSGTAEQLALRLRAYEQLGVNHLVLDFMTRDHVIPSLANILDQLERIHTELA